MGVEPCVLDSIRAEKESVQYKMIQMVRKRYNSNTACSLANVIEALKKKKLKPLTSKDLPIELEANSMFYKIIFADKIILHSTAVQFSKACQVKTQRQSGNSLCCFFAHL